jgi:N-methylhydantoinase B
VRRGDVMVLQTGGGGGFGDPRDRDPELVARDVGYGYVTREGAMRDYGVVMTKEGRLDPAETERLRAQLRQSSS